MSNKEEKPLEEEEKGSGEEANQGEDKEEFPGKSAAEVSAPDLDQAKQEVFLGEKQRKKRLIMVFLGVIVGLVVVSVLWFHFVSIDTLPMVCGAAVSKVEKRCGISRRETMARIKRLPSLVEEGDDNRRETCRVLASPEHLFWRKKATKKLLEMAKKNKALGEFLRRQSQEGKGGGIPSLRLKVKGRKEPIPVPTKIKQSGALSDVSRQFIILKVIPDFIERRYCKQITDESQ